MDSHLPGTPPAATVLPHAMGSTSATMQPAPDASGTLEFLRHELRLGQLTPQRRLALQQDLARRSTPALRAELDALLRRLPAAQTADVRDLLYR